MATLHQFGEGGYAFLEGGHPYSQGVVALPGHRLERARFARPLPIAEGFAAIRAHLAARGRATTALAACELRSPQPFTLDGFRAFNRGYVDVLRDWGLVRDGLNPVARSNVCPAHDPPAQPCFHAFTYTLEQTAGAHGGWVVAGSGEWPEDSPFPEGIVARGHLDDDALARKIEYVIATMRERATRLGADWSALTASNIYTVHDFHRMIGPQFAAAGLTAAGLTWQLCRPPILELEFEMDVRSVDSELVLRG